jgi:hypothetical protein
MHERLTIYVSSPKAYKDVFDIFYQCYNKFWKNPVFPFVLSTNYDAKYGGISVINSGNLQDSWTERTIGALNSIDSEYILLLCDDLFINESVNEEEITTILDLMDQYKIDYCRLNPYKGGARFYDGDLLYKVHKRMPYSLNLQRGIFRKEFLLLLLGDGSKSAWDLENEWLQKSQVAPNEYYDNIAVVGKNVISVIHAVQKGLFYPSVKSRLGEIGISIDSERQYMPRRTELIQHLKEFLGNRLFNPKIRYILKSLLGKLGFSFTSKY